jgi:hypothetical protein
MLKKFASRVATKEKCKRLIGYILFFVIILFAVVEICTYPRIHSLLTALRYINLSRVHHPRAKRKVKRCVRIDWTQIDLYDDTGLYGDHFEDLLQEISPYLEQKNSQLTSRERLYLGLHWLKNYPPLREYQKILDISPAVASQEINFVISKLYYVLRKRPTRIQLPEDWDAKAYDFDGTTVHGAIDCTSHFRRRVHPGQALYYRGDKKGFFLTAQVLCSVEGDRIYSVHLGLGHNNDRGMFKRTMQNIVEANDLRFLADLGYGHAYLVRPEKNLPEPWRKEQSALRSVVEVVCGLAQQYAVCSNKFRGNPEFQQIACMCVWELVNWNLQLFPLGVRHSSMCK